MTKTVCTFYESIGEFAAKLDRLPAGHKKSEAKAWNGNETFEQARQSLVKGKLSVVPKANALMDKLAGDAIELGHTQWEQSVAGFIPCVPAFLSGSPESMYRPTEVQSDRAPVRIFASVCVSAGIGTEDLEKRGIAILALCQKLSNIRPVELYIYADMGGSGWACIPCVKVETSPLDLSTATYALSGAAFLRQLCFGWAAEHEWSGQWAWDRDPNDSTAKQKTSELLGLGETDLLIPGGYSSDPIIKKPVEWLNKQIAKYTEQLEAA